MRYARPNFRALSHRVENGCCAGSDPLLDYPLRADVAQLVEHNLAKVGVAGSNPVVRSIDTPKVGPEGTLQAHRGRPFDMRSTRLLDHGDVAKW